MNVAGIALAQTQYENAEAKLKAAQADYTQKLATSNEQIAECDRTIALCDLTTFPAHGRRSTVDYEEAANRKQAPR